MNKFSTVFGIYKTRSETQETMDLLGDNGFDTSEISILFPENACAHSAHPRLWSAGRRGTSDGVFK